MKSSVKISLRCFFVCVCFVVVASEEIIEKPEARTEKTELEYKSLDESVGRVLEEGRTLVHHAMKRFMIILPAIFFKLGIAFTMLVLVTIVSVNNGFIGFLLLVVGLSSVLARLQEPRKPAVVPYLSPLSVYHNRAAQDWDRRDKGAEEGVTRRSYVEEYQQQYVYPPVNTYNPSYFVQKV